MIDRPVYVLRVRPAPRVNPIIALRAILKAMNWHGLRCVSVLEEASGNPAVLKDPGEDDVANAHTRTGGEND